MIFNKKF